MAAPQPFAADPVQNRLGRWGFPAFCRFMQAHRSTQFIRYQWVDLSGILRTIVETADAASRVAASNEVVGIKPSTYHLLIDQSRPAEVRGDVLHYLYPDWETLRPVAPDTAAVMCFCSDENRVEGTIFTYCPRKTLWNVVRSQVVQNLGAMLIAFEVEFVIAKVGASGEAVPFDSEPGFFAAASTRNQTYEYVTECAKELIAAGVQVQGFSRLGAACQYGLTLGELPPFDAVDQLVFSCETIRTVIARHGLIATMSPQPFARGPHNALLSRISVEQDQTGDTFFDDVVDKLPLICAVGMAYGVSYRRITDAGSSDEWYAGSRADVVRKGGPGTWEVRCIDAASNLYLAFSVLLMCAAFRDPSTGQTSPISLRPGELEEVPAYPGRVRLPTSLSAALNALEYNVSLFDGSGNSVLLEYVRLKQAEASRPEVLNEDRQRKRITKYF